MWHSQQVQQTRQGLANGAKYLQREPNSWEDLLDSGCLDRQLSQMNFNGGHQQHQPHQQQQQRGPVPTRQPVPLMSVMQPPPPHLLGHLINNGNSNNNGLLGRQPPPPLMSQTVAPPRPRYQQRVPHQQQFQPHPSTFIVRQPQQRINGGISQAIPPRATMIDTSVPPPRLPHFQPPPRPVLLQRPPPPVMKGPLTNTDLSAPFSNNTPTVKIVGEDEHRTQYTAPGPKVKILKRPSRYTFNHLICNALFCFLVHFY